MQQTCDLSRGTFSVFQGAPSWSSKVGDCEGSVLQTIALQECMVKNKEYYKDFIGPQDGDSGRSHQLSDKCIWTQHTDDYHHHQILSILEVCSSVL